MRYSLCPGLAFKGPMAWARCLCGGGIKVWGLGFRVWGLGFRVWGLGTGVLGIRVWPLGFGAWGLVMRFGV